MLIATAFLLPDEPCLGVVEVNLPRPDSKGRHRYQLTYVVRNDRIAEHATDMGPESNFPYPQIRVVAIFEHTVAEALSLAEQQRLGDTYWAKRVQEVAAESTLVTDMVNWAEERHKLVHNRSTFGAGFTKQRNGIDSRIFERKPA